MFKSLISEKVFSLAKRRRAGLNKLYSRTSFVMSLRLSSESKRSEMQLKSTLPSAGTLNFAKRRVI